MTGRTAQPKNNIPQLLSLGIAKADAIALRRISMILHRWHEHECNGTIQRDGDDGEGVPYWWNADTGRKLGRANDTEKGALRKLASIMAGYPTLTPYIQGDPRGCALHLIRPGDVPAGGDVSAYYSRGIPVW